MPSAFKKLLTVIWLLTSLHSYAQKKHVVEITSSVFTIQGKTNVNTFECELYQKESGSALNVVSSRTDFQLNFKGLKLRYKIESFNCEIAAMNNDLQDLLQSEKYPFLFLEIHNILIDPANQEIEQLKVSAEVSIMLAGIYQRYQISDGLVINRSEKELTFRGKKSLKMSDFNIDPPTKFFGIITVTDELQVEFEIHMEVQTL